MTPLTHKIEETGWEIAIIHFEYEDAIEVHIVPHPINSKSNWLWWYPKYKTNKIIGIPTGLYGDWSFLSIDSELTEKKLEGVMQSMWQNNSRIYRNYNTVYKIFD